MKDRCVSLLLITGLALLLTACGGGGGGLSTAPAPRLTVQAQPMRTLAFEWTADAQASAFTLFEDPDGPEGPAPETVLATLPAGSVSHTQPDVFLPDRVNATYRLRVCHGPACTDSAMARPASLNPAIGYFKASDTAANDQFGQGLALSADGRLLAVGAPFEDGSGQGIDPAQTRDAASADSGAVYLFERSAGAWVQTHYVKPRPAPAGGQFGQSVALSADGGVMLVGAIGPTGGGGAAYVFRRQANGLWEQEALLHPPVAEADAQAGYAVSLSGDGEWAVVSQPYAATGGAVHAYRHSAGGWALAQTLQALNTEAGDGFGESLALSLDGSTLVVGAYGESAGAAGPADNSVAEAGAAYVFARDAIDQWAQVRYLKSPQPAATGWFGAAVAVSGDGATVAVSEPFNANANANALPRLPRTHVFTGAGVWAPDSTLAPPAIDTASSHGWSLALSADGRTLAIGAPSDRGSASGLSGDNGERTVNLAGALRLYHRTGLGAWSDPVYVKASNNQPDNYFGWNAALSADGSMLAVYGSDHNAARGVGADQTDRSAIWAGAVYLY